MIKTKLMAKARRVLGIVKIKKLPPKEAWTTLNGEIVKLPRPLTTLDEIRKGAFYGARQVAREWGLVDLTRCEDSASHAIEQVAKRFLCSSKPYRNPDGSLARFIRGKRKGQLKTRPMAHGSGYRLWANFLGRNPFAYGFTIGVRHQLETLQRMEGKQEQALEVAKEKETAPILPDKLEGIIEVAKLGLSFSEGVFLASKMLGKSRAEAMTEAWPKLSTRHRHREANRAQVAITSALKRAAGE